MHTSDINDSKVIIALDFDNEDKAKQLIANLSPDLCKLKVGKEMFTRFGPSFVTFLVDAGYDVFLDLKFHDIPNTVAKACAAAADLGVWMVNVHASGGCAMMEAAKEGIRTSSHPSTLLTGVTVLTSMDQAQLADVVPNVEPKEQVLKLATLANKAGLDGVVCSAQEAQMLRAELPSSFKLVTPGIRPAGADVGDQKRVVTPADAIAFGVDYLVIGRPITQADSPKESLIAINQSIAI
ncbi:orotidine-5'-phosphate decarboxylase [Alteromonas sp. 5E99-2]|uniref:orotidine-5'-phosphate decarboxylase n=1 Tax=Alteromonas sp. 5E99-2 TaxID=2817683 RepID=UPI001A98BF0B|nr:orotidine-5'-phosphate decarboxylase [Alteromonas sp. 5E99-2]MBO1255086.1 orotidine-5'-phosphate decarboxylase [Alteromonas sp. 5E99-2]